MSIGATLASARRHAGLTVAEVSQRTRVRETIIQGIEQDDYAACGGDLYAQGHIRAIAEAVGTDPDVFDRYIHVMAADPAVKVHFYGKEVRPGRKIGHVTITGDSRDDLGEVRDRARRAASYLRWGAEDGD